MRVGTLTKSNRKKNLWISRKHPLYMENISFKTLYAAAVLMHTRLNETCNPLNNFEFDISKFAKDLNKKPKDIIKVLNDLSEKELISLDIVKNNDDIKENININNLYKRLTYLYVEEDKSEENKVDIVSEFERVFKRELIGREKHIINAWKQAGYQDSFLLAGLKEAEYNGEFSLTYIDTILDNWDKQGFKTEEDINKFKTTSKEDEIPFIEVEDFDWINQ